MSRTSATRDDSGTAELRDSAQRRQVTVLFADMAGFTPLAEKLGEEKTYLVMQRVHRELSEAVHEHDGTVQVMTGDGVMALFGAPVAIEDAPLRACRAALDIQSRMASLGEEIEAEHGARPAFRVGLHSGPLVIGALGDGRKMEVTALGDTVNLASRIESEADSGAVLMSEATHALVQGFVDGAYAGEHAIKGKAEPQKLWRLDGVKAGVSRFDVARGRGLTQLIGRRHEVETLEACWREAAAGAVRSVHIAGEAGIGKSRLAHEFRSHLDDGTTFILGGHCTADGRTKPFVPFIEVVRTSFRIADDADALDAERRLARGLEVLGLEAEAILPYLMNLLGLAPADGGLDKVAGEVLGIRTRDAISAMLRERCRLSPTVMFIEDLHWIDSASEDLLARAAGETEALPLLIVATYRPEYRAPWAGHENVTELRLAPLSGGGTAELLRERLGVAELPEALTRMVVEKSEGNPLFAEEITNYLVEAGSLRTGADGVSYDPGAGGAVLPVTLENLLMDRFDRLGEGPRAVLEAASVIGPRFGTSLVGAAAGLNGSMDKHLVELERLELIRREPERGDYRFKHALVQDAIYGSLLTARREALHGRVAETLEARHGAYPDEVAEALAHHWDRAGRPGKAVRFLALAGESSLRVYALEEAEQHFRRAIALIEADGGAADDTALTDILLHLARILYFQFEFFELIELVKRYLPRVESLGDPKRLSRFLFEGGYAHIFAAQAEPGRTLLDRARALGEESADEVAVAYADLGLMWHRIFWIELDEARTRIQREAGERIVEIGKRHGDIWLASKALLALGLDTMGARPGEAREDLRRLLALSRETNDPRPRTMGMWSMATLQLYDGDYEAAIESGDEALRVCLSPIDRMAARCYQACALVLMGRVKEGLAPLTGMVEQAQKSGMIFNMAVPLMIAGVGTVVAGEMARGVRAIEDTEARFTALGQEIFPSAAYDFLGRVYLQFAIGGQTPPISVMLKNFWFLLRTLPFAEKKARRYFEGAIAQRRAMDAPSALAGNLYSLGLLDQAKKRPAEARGHFEEARELAKSAEATALIDQIDAALADLSGS